MAIGDETKVNLFKAGPLNQAALAFGNAKVRNHGNNQFSFVNDGSSRFDFFPLIDPYSSWKRDAGNFAGLLACYNVWTPSIVPFPLAPLVPIVFGGGYNVDFIGTTYIPR